MTPEVRGIVAQTFLRFRREIRELDTEAREQAKRHLMSSLLGVLMDMDAAKDRGEGVKDGQ